MTLRGRTWHWLLGAALLLPGACKSEGERGVARKTIGVEGGLVSSTDGILRIVLLPGALDEDTEIVIFRSSEPPPIFGPAYRVQPDIPLKVGAEVTYQRTLPLGGSAIVAIRPDDYEEGLGAWTPLDDRWKPSDDAVAGIDDQLSLYYGVYEVAIPDDNDDEGTAGDDDDDAASTGIVVPTAGGTGEPMPMEMCGDGRPVAGELCYDVGPTIDAGNGIRDVEVGFFDDDELLDFATANAGNDNVTVRLNAGDGNFDGGDTSSAGANPRSIAVDDFDGDGLTDVIVANRGDDTIGLLVGDGEGGIANQDAIDVCDQPVSVAVTDGDGRPPADVVVACTGDDTLQVWAGGAELMMIFEGVASFSGIVGVVSDDLSGDRIPDWLVYGADMQHGWASDGMGGTTMDGGQQLARGADIVSAVIAAVTVPGDLIAIDAASDTVVIFLHEGGGVYGTMLELEGGSGLTTLAAADLSGDGIAEIVATSDEGVVYIYESGQQAYEEAVAIEVGSNPSAVAFASANEQVDPFPDILVADVDAGTVTVLVTNF